ncbi:MAG: energy transducer TonB [Acidobacteriaceae bacterium]
MRRILVASMLSSFALAAAAATTQPTDNPTPSAAVHRVTTGIAAPQLSTRAIVHIPGDAILDTLPNPAELRVRLDLDASGNATRVQVLNSISPNVDAHVIAAIRQFRWRPAVLDNQAIPLTVNLIVEVQH